MKGYYGNRNYALSSNQDQISNLEQYFVLTNPRLLRKKTVLADIYMRRVGLDSLPSHLTIFFAPTHPLPEPFLVAGGTI